MRDERFFLGIDPGLGVTGWAIVRGRELCDSGDIRCSKREPDLVEAIEDEVAAVLSQIGTAFPMPTVVVERYEYQGKARSSNPAGYTVAELAGSIATRAKCIGFTVLRVTRNEALGCFRVGGRASYGVPSEAHANAALAALLGVRLSNQHKRDAAMAAVAGQRRCR